MRVEKRISHPPARLTAANGVIDSGLPWGHSCPWVVWTLHAQHITRTGLTCMDVKRMVHGLGMESTLVFPVNTLTMTSFRELSPG